MIQRIQTAYILLAAILIGLLFALPFAEIAQAGNFYQFNIQGIVKDGTVQENGLPIALFIALILILHVVTVFIYRKRILQIRILVFSIILLLGLFGLFYFFTYHSFKHADISFKITVAFPLVAIILDYLAIRAIGRDEILVRSVDRIR